LGRFFGIEATFWINLQGQYDLETTAAEMGERLTKEVSPLAA
jgi:plasmid maintenance system antidote protein VapI